MGFFVSSWQLASSTGASPQTIEFSTAGIGADVVAGALVKGVAVVSDVGAVVLVYGAVVTVSFTVESPSSSCS